jgi:hypothetical protein
VRLGVCCLVWQLAAAATDCAAAQLSKAAAFAAAPA